MASKDKKTKAEEQKTEVKLEKKVQNETPVLNEKPIINEKPVAIEKPIINEKPVVIEKPSINEIPGVIDKPEIKDKPEVTEIPDPIITRPENPGGRPTIDGNNSSQRTRSNLMLIKGIDDAREELLYNEGITSTSVLVTAGDTNAKRRAIAEKVLRKERGNITANLYTWTEKYLKQVESWVKQADLYRVKGMDPDTAYMLVQLGVRYVEDLPKIDIAKAYPMLRSLAQIQTEYKLISKENFQAILVNSNSVESRNSIHLRPDFKTMLQQQLKVDAADMIQNVAYNQFVDQIGQIQWSNLLSETPLEIDDAAPEYLFRSTYVKPTEISYANNANNFEIIETGLGYLNDIQPVLQLPRLISGYIYMISSGKMLPDAGARRREFAFVNARVEITGISSPNQEKGEDYENPHAYTDAYGKFVIRLPDKYNLEEQVNLIISQDGYSIKFSLTAEEILSHVEEQELLNKFNRLDVIVMEIQNDTKQLEEVQNKRKECEPNSSEDESLKKDENRLKNLILENQEIEKKLRNEINLSDKSTTDLEKILRNLVAKSNLCADFTEDPFVVVREVFRGYRTDSRKVLPSVKLMENDNQPIYLPTDTAPSKVYTYSMLQRLVEPTVTSITKSDNNTAPTVTNGRQSVQKGISVDDFREKIMTDPDSIPQMSSLGIGYSLNMHQAWIPDGFSLGTLLYSLVLAPGEEQRMIVREKQQSYALTDDSIGTDSVSETYGISQTDNSDAAYNYALNQLTQGNSHYDYSTKTTSVGGSLGVAGAANGVMASLGLNAGYSKSSGDANATASQSNIHNEASTVAQNFQHSIKTAAEKISSAQRISMSLATSNESDSVATRIIANHNHSHTMTVQYWEVMRRYRLETCIQGIDLVLFVPLKLINFLNGAPASINDPEAVQNASSVKSRYRLMNKYASVLENALPYRYQGGLELIQKYTAMPNWELYTENKGSRTLTFTIYGHFLPVDHFEATLIVKSGKPNIAGDVDFNFNAEVLSESRNYKTSASLRQAITEFRRTGADGSSSAAANDYCKFTFVVPETIADEELDRITISYSCSEVHYVLYKNAAELAANGDTAAEVEKDMWHYRWDLAKDFDNSSGDVKRIRYQEEILPEAWIHPNVTLSSREVKSLAQVRIISSDFSYGAKQITPTGGTIGADAGGVQTKENSLTGTLSSTVIRDRVYVNLSGAVPTLTLNQLQKMEQCFQHVVSNTMQYSQAVWASLTADERVMLLEGYTIDMDYDNDGSVSQVSNSKDRIDIPLLNCIDVRKLLGFYGNCMLFPFTYPQKFAEKVKKTAAEVQDALYKSRWFLHSIHCKILHHDDRQLCLLHCVPGLC